MKCILLPICQGGCVRSRMVNKSSCFYNVKLIKYIMEKYSKIVCGK